jgi:hypothetical protein
VLDNKLDKNVDKAMKDLAEATAKANQMRKEAGFMWMYITNLILFAVFLIILVLGMNNKC